MRTCWMMSVAPWNTANGAATARGFPSALPKRRDSPSWLMKTHCRDACDFEGRVYSLFWSTWVNKDSFTHSGKATQFSECYLTGIQSLSYHAPSWKKNVLNIAVRHITLTFHLSLLWQALKQKQAPWLPHVIKLLLTHFKASLLAVEVDLAQFCWVTCLHCTMIYCQQNNEVYSCVARTGAYFGITV